MPTLSAFEPNDLATSFLCCHQAASPEYPLLVLCSMGGHIYPTCCVSPGHRVGFLPGLPHAIYRHPGVYLYRLVIPRQSLPELRLYDLCQVLRSALRRTTQEGDSTLKENAALIARPTASGGYEVRMTWSLARVAARVAPSYYIEEAAEVEDLTRWKLYLGDRQREAHLGLEAPRMQRAARSSAPLRNDLRKQ